MAEAQRLEPEVEDRVLLLAPTRRDASAAGRLFAAAGFSVTLCGDLQGLCAEARRGAGALIVPEEAVRDDKGDCLGRLLADQPPWSDLPVVVLTMPRSATPPGRAADVDAGADADAGPEPAGNITLVRRPVEVRALASTVRAALRDRRRQYAMRAALAEREDQARALREADRHKDEFLAMLAHELRNPLAAVNNAVSVLKLSPDEESRAWGTDVLSRQVRHLARLIDDLLDVSRVTSGKIRLRKEYLDAGPVLDQAVESARPLIDERRHALTVSVDRGRLPLLADADRVEQIVVNLLTNAAKYTECGGRVWLTAAREGGHVVVRVRDNGMGIVPERLPEMFRLFSQGDRALDRSLGGLGIGLPVVRALTEMHGGTIDARSDGPGRGSEFVVRLPAVAAPASASGPAPAAVPSGDRRPDHSASAAGRQLRILVVDDSVDTARGVTRLLQRLGHEVTAVHDGRAAVEAARGIVPDCVLLDIGLPVLDGYQVAQALRDDARLRDTVIIAVSGYGQAEDRRRSRESGFDHHLIKPVSLDTLAALIAHCARPTPAEPLPSAGQG